MQYVSTEGGQQGTQDDWIVEDVRADWLDQFDLGAAVADGQADDEDLFVYARLGADDGTGSVIDWIDPL